MNQEQIIGLIKGIAIHKIPVHADFTPRDFYALIRSYANAQLEAVDNLPLNLKLTISNINAIDIQKEQLVADVLMASSSSKLLVPDIDELHLRVTIPYEIVAEKLQLLSPEIKTEITSSSLQNKLVNPIIKQVIQSNQAKLESDISSRINPLLSHPSQIIDLLSDDKKKLVGHLVKELDYNVHFWEGSQNTDHVLIQTIASLNTESSPSASEDTAIEVNFESTQLIPILLEKINSDIKSKVEQDVEIHKISLISQNTLEIIGQAGVMNLSKTFNITTNIVFDNTLQLLRLKVSDIEIDGGFLVRKGFELVKPKIRSIIESSAKIDLKPLIDKLLLPLTIPYTSIKYDLKPDHVIIDSIVLDENQNNTRWKLSVILQSGILQLRHSTSPV